MLINLQEAVINIETNEGFVDENGKEVTLDSVLRLAVSREERAEKKEEAYEFLKRLVNEENKQSFVIKSEEVTYLKDQIRSIFIVPIAGWVCDYLEGIKPDTSA